MAPIFVTGISHKSAPVEVREALAIPEAEVSRTLGDLRAAGAVREAMILSTCNRVEVYGADEREDVADGRLFGLLCERRGIDAASVRPFVYTKVHAEAARHCFRVASSLDSMIVGEPQILGQVKAAFDLARQCGTVGPRLHELLSRALSVAKRVRSDTRLAQGAVSVPGAAVELARKIFGDLAGRSVLLIGAGQMGELAARHLLEQRISTLYVANRTWSRARELAEALSGTAVPFERWGDALATVDIVIASVSAPHPLVTPDGIGAALAARRARPLFFVDIAVPRSVDPRVNDLANIFCYDIDDLRSVAEANLRERWREAASAEGLVEREVEKFLARLSDRDMAPAIAALCERVEAVRQGEVARALACLRGASPETRSAIEALSSALVNKILHSPISRLRESAREGSGSRWVGAVSELFALDLGDGSRAHDEARVGGPMAGGVSTHGIT
jgi:glutamyl-tRNA reductase